MSDTRFCPICNHNVMPKFRINWIILIILLLLGVILGVIYLVYCLVDSSHRQCPDCGCTNLLPPKPEKVDTENKADKEN